MADHGPGRPLQFAVGAGTLVLSALLAWGASGIPSAAGYAGVGPDFLPWMMALGMAVCAVLLLWQAWRGGWQDVEPPSGAQRGDWHALAWVVAGVVANAALITTIGFVLSCTLCFALAVRGLRVGEGRAAGGAMRTLYDIAGGLLLSLPVFWMFSRLLGIHLPALSAGRWI
jgi:putative tricarboxylic transport membrane protein